MYQSLGPVKVVSGENLAGGLQEVRLLQKGLQVVPAATSRRKDNIQHKPLRANKSEVGLASLFPTQKECYKVCSQTFVSQRNKSMAHRGFETHIIVLPTYCNTERFRLRKGGGGTSWGLNISLFWTNSSESGRHLSSSNHSACLIYNEIPVYKTCFYWPFNPH